MRFECHDEMSHGMVSEINERTGEKKLCHRNSDFQKKNKNDRQNNFKGVEPHSLSYKDLVETTGRYVVTYVFEYHNVFYILRLSVTVIKLLNKKRSKAMHVKRSV